MEITIRKSVSQAAKDNIPLMIQTALGFLKNKYPSVDFDNVDIIFSGSGSRGRYYRNDEDAAEYKRPTAFIPTQRKDELLYWRPSLGMVRQEVKEVGCFDVCTSTIIHELTHHAQYEQKRSTGEVETTQNELEYYKQNRPDVYELFMSE